jgi:glucokinase
MEWVLAIDLGGTNIKAGVVGADGTIAVSRSVKTFVQRGPAKVLAAMVELANGLKAECGRPITRGGVGSPGPLSQARGEVCGSPNLPGWDAVPVVRTLEQGTGLRFVLENDANAACLGEKLFGAGKPFDPIVHFTLGTGVGGGVYLDGKLFTGPSGAGAELGHMCLDLDGLRCGCGSYGCLETFASDTGIRAFVAAEGGRFPDSPLNNFAPENVNFKAVMECRAKADPFADEVYRRVVRALGAGIASYVNIFNPQAVILSGGMINAGKPFFADIEAVMRQRAIKVLADGVVILPSVLGDNTGVLGAAACALGI